MKKVRFSKIAIVAGDPSLAEIVCQHFRRQGTYLPLFAEPLMRMEKWGVFQNDCIRICNAILYLQPAYVLMLRCNKKVISKLIYHLRNLPEDRIIILESFDEPVLSRLPGYRKNISADHLYEVMPNNLTSGHIIGVEDNDELSKVIARNLAASDHAKIVYLPKTTRKEVSNIHDQLRLWASGSTGLEREDAKNTIIRFIEGRLGTIINSKSDSISFITLGIPYGIYPFKYPTTHYFSFPLLGLNLIRGMLKSSRGYLRCPAAFLCDPGEFQTSEFEDLLKIFISKGYVLRTCFGKSAKLRNVRYISEHLPLDIIFYSTHCGEVEGQRFTERFETSNGEEHIIVYDSVSGFHPTSQKGMFDVQEQIFPISIDGVNWSDEEGKTRIGAGKLFTAFIEGSLEQSTKDRKDATVATLDAGIVKGSDALSLHDSILLPAGFLNIGGFKYPIVFSNACTSWRNHACIYAAKGASIYIGTTLAIPNLIAVSVATRFARAAINGHSLGYCLYRAQREYISDLGYTPYLMHGYLYAKCPPVGSLVDNYRVFHNSLVKAIDSWKEYLSVNQSERLRRNSSEVIQYLEEELRHFIMDSTAT